MSRVPPSIDAAMVVDFTQIALDFIGQYGLFAIFLLLVLDAAMLLPGLPGELIMILAVTRYARDPLSLSLVILMATTAATVGSLLLYGIARGVGKGFVERHPRLFLMSPQRREKLEKSFQRPSGQSLVFFMRLLPLARLLVNLPAGLAKMPWLRFTILTFFGNLVFHAGLMWLAYEFRRPGSELAAQADILQASYANPAWAYVEANWIFVAVTGLLLALVLSIRASMKAHRRPEAGYDGSLVGFLARAILIWGGLAVLVGLYLDPGFVYEIIALSGYDARNIQLGIPFEPVSVLAAMGGGAIFLGWMVSSLARGARKKVKRVHRARLAAEARKASAPKSASESRAPVEFRETFGAGPPRRGPP